MKRARGADRVREIVLRVQRISTLPGVVTRVMQMVENPETSAEDLESVIATDQALAAKVLRLVNSPYYGFPRRVSTISQAIVILGFNTVKSLALSASVFDAFHGRGAALDRPVHWRHSIETGILGQILAEGRTRGDEAFVAGILHDVGKVALDQNLPDEYREVHRRVAEGGRLRACETAVFGAEHAEVGGWIGEAWNFPVQIVETIAYHHEPERAREASLLVHVVAAANVLVRSADPAAIPAPWRAVLRLDEAASAAARARFEAEAGRIDALVEIATGR